MIFKNNTSQEKRYVYQNMLYIFPPRVAVDYPDITHEFVDPENNQTVTKSLENEFIAMGLEKLEVADEVMKMQRTLTPEGEANLQIGEVKLYGT